MEELTSFCLSFGVQLWKGPGLHFFAFARVGAIHSGSQTINTRSFVHYKLKRREDASMKEVAFIGGNGIHRCSNILFKFEIRRFLESSNAVNYQPFVCLLYHATYLHGYRFCQQLLDMMSHSVKQNIQNSTCLSYYGHVSGYVRKKTDQQVCIQQT